ncbi:hypothetical protein [Clostridium septicum]|uniref:Uncharacterized protein n=1 Tax=Clostridium septicum TaxID=1504 RepID=A0A9N7JKP4_CLOSE|nr:hypothetical protein [Clostridium septicum]AYE34120.1 hypothetical protein CP523_06365 [Clostridium septicum]MDU1313083.1 hypothetical protein [Clostridium septicum]QAS59486.1 hypothetical protein EI377_00835 [Clostridium septicum]UEC21253.1 hypothetical protein LK444_02425 [Clostridium septicum]USS00702.1 hypothetical protein NH397_14670 [Clostridium septicum]
MENEKNNKVGAGILTVAIIQFVLSGFGILFLGLGLLFKDAINAQLKSMGNDPIPDGGQISIIISFIFMVLAIIGLILILRKKAIGIYLYFAVQVLDKIFGAITQGVNIIGLIVGLILPVLMAIFVYKKRALYGFENNLAE